MAQRTNPYSSSIDSRIAHLRFVYPDATISYSPKRNKIFIIKPRNTETLVPVPPTDTKNMRSNNANGDAEKKTFKPRKTQKQQLEKTEPIDPCVICLDNKPTHYFNCRCVRKHPVVCIQCLKNKQFVQSSKCPNCRSWFTQSATTPFSPEQMYTGKTKPKKELLPWQQTKLNKSLVRVLTKTRSGPRMVELIEQGADIHYEDANAVLYAARNGHIQIFDFLVNILDYKTIFSLEFHIKILEAAYQNLGSNQSMLLDILLSVNTDDW